MNMNSATRTSNPVHPRPDGASDTDEESEDDDIYMIPAFPTSRRGAKCVAVPNEKTPVVESWGRFQSEAVRLACMRGNLEKLKQLFSNGSSPGVHQVFRDTEETPLMTCCKAGHYELVKYLLQQKSANPNACDPASKITPLMIACAGEAEELQLLECVKFLLEAGANLDMQNQYGHTALGIAIRQKRTLLAKYLIENKADVNIIDPDGQSVIFYAAMNGNGEICRFLLENRADIQLVDKNGWTAPEVAQDKGFDRLAVLLFNIQRDSKWNTGVKPELMQQLDEEGIGTRKDDSDSISRRQISLIELILSGVEATKYLENFGKHEISYVQFLNLDDNQLREIGIDELGVRESILDHAKRTHKVPWLISSLETPALISNKTVTAAEAACMIVSIGDHLKYISGTLQFIKSRIKGKPFAFHNDVEKHKIGHLLGFCKETETNCNLVRKDVVEIHTIIDGLSGYTELQIAGQIPKKNFQKGQLVKKPGKSIIKFGIGTGLLVLSLLLFKIGKVK